MPSEVQPNAVIWEVLAQCWVDTEYDAVDLDAFARQLQSTGMGVEQIERVVFDEVCGAFALDTLAGTSGRPRPNQSSTRDK